MKVANKQVRHGNEIRTGSTIQKPAGFVPNMPSILTAAPAELGNFKGVMPEFGRAKDVQYISGIKRGLLHLLVAEGKIKSVLIRRKGNVHGTRYYSIQSVISYLNNLMEEQSHETQSAD